MNFVTIENNIVIFPLEIPNSSRLWQEFKSADIRTVIDALTLVIPKLATEIPFDSYTLLYLLDHPKRRNHRLGWIISRMVDLGHVPLIKGGKRGSSIRYFLNPTA